MQSDLRFPGQYYDAETALHDNWKRYQEAESGRYLAPDPVGFEGRGKFPLQMHHLVGVRQLEFIHCSTSGVIVQSG